MALVMVMYSYLGIEIIGVTAGEAHDPKSTIKKAIDEVFWRILIFYVLSLGVIMSIYPWNEIGHMGSPFVVTFENLASPVQRILSISLSSRRYSLPATAGSSAPAVCSTICPCRGMHLPASRR